MKKSDRQGWIIVGVVGGIFLLIGTLAVYANIAEKEYDPTTLCPSEGEYPVVRILIDKTDPWDKQRSVRLEKIIREIKDDLALSERMGLYVLDESGSEVPAPVFDMCNPGRGNQANPFYRNPRRVHQKFENQFDLPLEEMLVDILKPGTAPRSPILEAIKNFPDGGSQDRLVIISDLMQNSDQLSFYRKDFSSLDGANGFGMGAPINQYSSITVYYIDRENISEKRKDSAIAFWKQYFNQMSTSLVFNRL